MNVWTTAWFTARPQRPGDRFEVLLPRPQTMAAAAVEMHYPFDEFGRHLVLFLRGEHGAWQRVAYADGPDERWETVRDLVERPREARLVMRFAHTPQLVGDLEHWQHDTFLVRWRDRALNADAFASFDLTPDGEVRELRMEAVSSLTDFSFDFHHLRLTPLEESP